MRPAMIRSPGSRPSRRPAAPSRSWRGATRAPELRNRVPYRARRRRARKAAAEAAEKDRRIVERLAAVLNDLGVHNDGQKADAEYAAAFRAYGVDLDAIDPDAPARPGRQPGRPPELANAPRSVGLPASGARLRDPAGANVWSRSPRRPIPTRGGIGCGTRFGRRKAGPARKLEALERLAATADVGPLPGGERHPAGLRLAFLGRRETAIACCVAPRARIATISGSTPTLAAS